MLQVAKMFIVVSAEGAVLANMTSGVDAHLIQKVTPGASTWRCVPNSSQATLVAGEVMARSNRQNKHVTRLSKGTISEDVNSDFAQHEPSPPETRVC
jgi:hypothetical protein